MVAVADVEVPEPQLRDGTRTPSPVPLMASPRENGEEIGGPIVDAGGSNKHLSCAACSLTGKLRYPPGPQAPPPNPARTGGKRPPSRLRQAAATPEPSSSGALTGGEGHSPAPDNDTALLALDSYQSSATSRPRSSPRLPATPPGTTATATTTTCSYHDPSGRAFRLNFDSSGGPGPDPSIKCAIDHLDKDLAVDLKVQRHPPSDSKFSLDCFNPSDPHNNLKLKVEIFKTSSRGFGLRIIQTLPKAPSPSGSSTPSLDDGKYSSKSTPKRRGDSTSPLVSSLTNSTSSSNASSTSRSRESRKTKSSAPRIKDLSDFDEVRMSSGQESKAEAESQLDHDHCYCTSPCGAPQCKAQLDEKPQEIQKLQGQAS